MYFCQCVEISCSDIISKGYLLFRFSNLYNVRTILYSYTDQQEPHHCILLHNYSSYQSKKIQIVNIQLCLTIELQI